MMSIHDYTHVQTYVQLVRAHRAAKGNSKALPSQFVFKQDAADNKHTRAIRHHTGSHYHMAGSKQFQKGIRVKGVISRHSRQVSGVWSVECEVCGARPTHTMLLFQIRIFTITHACIHTHTLQGAKLQGDRNKKGAMEAARGERQAGGKKIKGKKKGMLQGRCVCVSVCVCMNVDWICVCVCVLEQVSYCADVYNAGLYHSYIFIHTHIHRST
jgi:hypothetical protein